MIPLSWIWRSNYGGRKSWWQRLPGAILALGVYYLLWLALPSTVFWTWIGVMEIVGWLPQVAGHYDFALHGARGGIWLGWPPHVELRLWNLHAYFGWEPLADKTKFDLSARLLWHRSYI